MHLTVLSSLVIASLVALPRDVASDPPVFTTDDLELATLLDRAWARCLKTIEITGATIPEPVKAGTKNPVTTYDCDNQKLEQLKNEWEMADLCATATQFISCNGKYTVAQGTAMMTKWMRHFGEPKGILTWLLESGKRMVKNLLRVCPFYIAMEAMQGLEAFKINVLTSWSSLITQSITRCEADVGLTKKFAEEQFCEGKLLDAADMRFVKWWLSCVLASTARQYKPMKYDAETEGKFVSNLVDVLCTEQLLKSYILEEKTQRTPQELKKEVEKKKKEAHERVIVQTKKMKAKESEDAELKQHFVYMYSESVNTAIQAASKKN